MVGLFDQLGCTNVSNEECCWCLFACNGVTGRKVRVDECGALAAYAQGQSILLRGTGQVAIDVRDIGMAAGQRRNKEGIMQMATEKMHAGVDAIKINFG